MDSVNGISFPNLGISFSNVPTGFHLFGREIKLYAIIIGTAFLIAMFLANREAKKTKQDTELYVDAFLVTVIPAILGARLYYVIFEWDHYKNDLKSIFYIWNGGLAIYGGIIAGVVTLFIFSRVRKYSFGLILDTLVPGLALGQALGRWGNFFNREAFGENSDGIFAMRIPTEHIYTYFSSKVTVHDGGGLSYIQVHPTFLYESVLNLLLLIVLLLYTKHKKFNGEIALGYLGGYGIIRFFVEGIRTDQLKIGSTGIAVSQLLGMVLFIAAILTDVIVRICRRKKGLQELPQKAAVVQNKVENDEKQDE